MATCATYIREYLNTEHASLVPDRNNVQFSVGLPHIQTIPPVQLGVVVVNVHCLASLWVVRVTITTVNYPICSCHQLQLEKSLICINTCHMWLYPLSVGNHGNTTHQVTITLTTISTVDLLSPNMWLYPSVSTSLQLTYSHPNMWCDAQVKQFVKRKRNDQFCNLMKWRRVKAGLLIDSRC